MKNKKSLNFYIIAYVLCIIVAALVALFLKSVVGIIVAAIIIMFPLAYYFLGIRQGKGEKTLQNLNEFINVFTYFKIYVQNGMTVYDSFLEIRKYCSSWMLEQIDILISEMDDDKSILPFINFAKKFNNDVIEEIMITIYQMIDDGTSFSHINSFTYLFDEFKKNNEKNNVDQKERSWSSKTNLCLIGSGIFTLAIMFGVIGMLGATLNGF